MEPTARCHLARDLRNERGKISCEYFSGGRRYHLMAKKSKRGTRYTAARKAKILAAAEKKGLTGAQVAKRFGVSTLTFYRWRGPVRSDALRRADKKRGPGRPKGNGGRRVDPEVVRQAVRTQIERTLPQIIREEVAAAVGFRKR